MEGLIVYNKCCGAGHQVARKLKGMVEDATGVRLHIAYRSYASSKAEFDANGILIGEASVDPVIAYGKLWISPASKALGPLAVERLIYLVGQEKS